MKFVFAEAEKTSTSKRSILLQHTVSVRRDAINPLYDTATTPARIRRSYEHATC